VNRESVCVHYKYIWGLPNCR